MRLLPLMLMALNLLESAVNADSATVGAGVAQFVNVAWTCTTGLLLSFSFILLVLVQCCKKKLPPVDPSVSVAASAAPAGAGAVAAADVKEGAAAKEAVEKATKDATLAEGMATGAATKDLFGGGGTQTAGPPAGAPPATCGIATKDMFHNDAQSQTQANATEVAASQSVVDITQQSACTAAQTQNITAYTQTCS